MTDEKTGAESTEADLREKNAEIIAKFNEEFEGDIGVFPVPKRPDEVLIVARPRNAKTYQALVNQLADKKFDKAVALENFALRCTVHPSADEVKRIFGRYPAFADAVAARATELAGGEIQELGKD